MMVSIISLLFLPLFSADSSESTHVSSSSPATSCRLILEIDNVSSTARSVQKEYGISGITCMTLVLGFDGEYEGTSVARLYCEGGSSWQEAIRVFAEKKIKTQFPGISTKKSQQIAHALLVARALDTSHLISSTRVDDTGLSQFSQMERGCCSVM